jgi:hypothetical protein
MSDRSAYEGYIPPEWDRSDAAGGLIDSATGAPIREVEWFGGWVRGSDGTAIRDTDVAQPIMGPGGGAAHDPTPGQLLLLLSN